MSDEIQVSVLVPSYDHEVFVAAAVRSVLEQTAVSFEVIAIDDGSNDSSVARLEEIEDSRLIVVRQENRGLSRTLNRGLEMARGRWAKMLPSDDLLEPGALAAQVQEAEASESAVVFCLPTVVDAADQRLGDPGPQAWFDLPESDSARLLRAMVPRNPLCAPGALFDRELAVRVGGFDPSLRVAQDYDLWFRLLQEGTGQLVPERRVRVRWHGGNQSAQATEATEAERAYALVGALVRRGMQWWADQFESRVSLAAALVASGLREARPFARASLVAARTDGESFGSHPELAALLQEAPELARPGDWGGLPAGTTGWG